MKTHSKRGKIVLWTEREVGTPRGRRALWIHGKAPRERPIGMDGCRTGKGPTIAASIDPVKSTESACLARGRVDFH